MKAKLKTFQILLFSFLLVFFINACGKGEGGDENLGGGGGPTVNNAPVADAGPDQTKTVLVGDVVVLDGSHSGDADGDSLIYSWVLMALPSGSTATLSDPTLSDPNFVADQPGDYIAQLTVNDGTVDSAVDEVSVTVRVPPPVITINKPENLMVVANSPVTVEGTVDDLAATVMVNGTGVLNHKGSYSTSVLLQEGSNIITVVGQNGTGENSVSVEVILNTTNNPAVSITSHKAGFLVGEEFEIGEAYPSAQVLVGGVIKVNTSVLFANTPTVTVNGVAAAVLPKVFNSDCGLINFPPFKCFNFTAPIALEKGARTITAVGTDVQRRKTTVKVDGTVDYCRKAVHDENNPNYGIDPREPRVPAVRDNNQSNRCIEIDGCSMPFSDDIAGLKFLANNPMPLANQNAVPIEFGSGTAPPSEFFVFGLQSSRALGCNIHDGCYQTHVPEANRVDAWRECNLNQYKDHLALCRRAYPPDATCPHTGVNAVLCPAWRIDWLSEKAICARNATAYFTAVSTGYLIGQPWGGWKAYQDRQEQYSPVP
ncbi:MAG TPA: PKD domain-containing protein [Nitrospiria bacterium]